MLTVKIEIVSDVTCPWCYIGKRRLEGALHQLNDLDLQVEILWQPFQLNPGMPPEGMDRQVYRTAKFGTWEYAQALEARLIAVGAAEGIPFAFDGIERTPNTLNSHRLIWLARHQGAQDRVVEALFQGYFLQARDIGDPQVLLDIGCTSGLDPRQIEALLQGDTGLAEVEQEEERARVLGISGVPHFVLNGRSALSGAQPSEVMAEAVRQAVKLANV